MGDIQKLSPGCFLSNFNKIVLVDFKSNVYSVNWLFINQYSLEYSVTKLVISN